MANDVKWIKLAVDVFDDEKIKIIEAMPDADGILVIWFKILTLAGKININGVLIINDKIPFTDEMLASIFNRKISQVRLALQIFQDLEMIEIINNVVTISNWSKHQKLDSLENKTEYMREYMRERRAKQKQIALGKDTKSGTISEECKTNSKTNDKTNSKTNVNQTDLYKPYNTDIYNKEEIKTFGQNDTKNDTKTVIKTENDTLFDRFWNVYPKKVGKKNAIDWFNKKHKGFIVDEMLVEKMVAKINEYVTKGQWTDENKQYIPHPQTWLNRMGWEDEVISDKKNKQKDILDYIDNL